MVVVVVTVAVEVEVVVVVVVVASVGVVVVVIVAVVIVLAVATVAVRSELLRAAQDRCSRGVAGKISRDHGFDFLFVESFIPWRDGR